MPDTALRGTYKVATGHDIPLVSLAVVTPQPREGAVRPTRRDYTDTTWFDQALYSQPMWTATDRGTYQAILTQFGLLTAKTALVTWWCPNEVFTWTRYNGRALQPQMGQDVNHTNYFTRDVVIYIVDLVALVEP